MFNSVALNKFFKKFIYLINFETGSHCVGLAGLKFDLETRWSQSHRPPASTSEY